MFTALLEETVTSRSAVLATRCDATRRDETRANTKLVQPRHAFIISRLLSRHRLAKTSGCFFPPTSRGGERLFRLGARSSRHVARSTKDSSRSSTLSLMGPQSRTIRVGRLLRNGTDDVFGSLWFRSKMERRGANYYIRE